MGGSIIPKSKNSSDLGHFILACPQKKVRLHSDWTPLTLADTSGYTPLTALYWILDTASIVSAYGYGVERM